MTNRQLQAQNTKERILKTAYELIEKNSYEKTSIKEICKAAKVSVGAFYHHFQSKQGIIIAGYEECDIYFKENVFGMLTSQDPVARIAEYIDFQMDYAVSTGIDLMIELYKAQITDGAEFFLQTSRGLPQGLYTIVEAAQQAGAITKEQSVGSITSELLLISRGVIYNWCQNKGNYDLRAYCHKIITAHLYSYTL
jgi:Transcriptional regulator